MYFPPHETAVKNHFSPCSLLLSNIRYYWLSLLSMFLLKCQWSLSLSHYIKKEKQMCSSHPPFLFPCWICLTSLHKSYHQLMYIYILVKLSIVYFLSSLPWHTFSCFFSVGPDYSFCLSLKFAGSLRALSQAHFSPNFHSHGFNYYIYVPTGPFSQGPESCIWIEPPAWLHLDCPAGALILTC